MPKKSLHYRPPSLALLRQKSKLSNDLMDLTLPYISVSTIMDRSGKKGKGVFDKNKSVNLSQDNNHSITVTPFQEDSPYFNEKLTVDKDNQ